MLLINVACYGSVVDNGLLRPSQGGGLAFDQLTQLPALAAAGSAGENEEKEGKET